MLNPRDIENVEINERNFVDISNIKNIEDPLYYDLEDPKDYKKFILNIKRLVRSSIEYKDLVAHVKENYFNNTSGINSIDTDVKCELHHIPFTLEDIIELVYCRNKDLNLPNDIISISRDILDLHFNSLIGLYNLNRTEHEMIHNNTLFIPLQCIYGNVVEFVNIFKNYMSEYQIDIFETYLKMSNELNDKIMNKEYFDIKYLNTNMNSNLEKLNDYLINKINNYNN